eukprot:g3372.t1
MTQLVAASGPDGGSLFSRQQIDAPLRFPIPVYFHPTVPVAIKLPEKALGSLFTLLPDLRGSTLKKHLSLDAACRAGADTQLGIRILVVFASFAIQEFRDCASAVAVRVDDSARTGSTAKRVEHVPLVRIGLPFFAQLLHAPETFLLSDGSQRAKKVLEAHEREVREPVRDACFYKVFGRDARIMIGGMDDLSVERAMERAVYLGVREEAVLVATAAAHRSKRGGNHHGNCGKRLRRFVRSEKALLEGTGSIGKALSKAGTLGGKVVGNKHVLRSCIFVSDVVDFRTESPYQQAVARGLFTVDIAFLETLWTRAVAVSGRFLQNDSKWWTTNFQSPVETANGSCSAGAASANAHKAIVPPTASASSVEQDIVLVDAADALSDDREDERRAATVRASVTSRVEENFIEQYVVTAAAVTRESEREVHNAMPWFEKYCRRERRRKAATAGGQDAAAVEPWWDSLFSHGSRSRCGSKEAGVADDMVVAGGKSDELGGGRSRYRNLFSPGASDGDDMSDGNGDDDGDDESSSSSGSASERSDDGGSDQSSDRESADEKEQGLRPSKSASLRNFFAPVSTQLPHFLFWRLPTEASLEIAEHALKPLQGLYIMSPFSSEAVLDGAPTSGTGAAASSAPAASIVPGSSAIRLAGGFTTSNIANADVLVVRDSSSSFYVQARHLKIQTATVGWLECSVREKKCFAIAKRFRVTGPLQAKVPWRLRYFEGFLFLLSHLPTEEMRRRMQFLIWHGGGFTTSYPEDPTITHVVVEEGGGRIVRAARPAGSGTFAGSFGSSSSFSSINTGLGGAGGFGSDQRAAGGFGFSGADLVPQVDLLYVSTAWIEHCFAEKGYEPEELATNVIDQSEPISTNAGSSVGVLMDENGSAPGIAKNNCGGVSSEAWSAAAGAEARVAPRATANGGSGTPSAAAGNGTAPPPPQRVSKLTLQTSMYFSPPASADDSSTPRGHGAESKCFNGKLLALVGHNNEKRLNSIFVICRVEGNAAIVVGQQIAEHEQKIDYFVCDDGFRPSTHLPFLKNRKALRQDKVVSFLWAMKCVREGRIIGPVPHDRKWYPMWTPCRVANPELLLGGDNFAPAARGGLVKVDNSTLSSSSSSSPVSADDPRNPQRQATPKRPCLHFCGFGKTDDPDPKLLHFLAKALGCGVSNSYKEITHAVVGQQALEKCKGLRMRLPPQLAYAYLPARLGGQGRVIQPAEVCLTEKSEHEESFAAFVARLGDENPGGQAALGTQLATTDSQLLLKDAYANASFLGPTQLAQETVKTLPLMVNHMGASISGDTFSEKVFELVQRGIPVVSFGWLCAVYAQGRSFPPEPYEVFYRLPDAVVLPKQPGVVAEGCGMTHSHMCRRDAAMLGVQRFSAAVRAANDNSFWLQLEPQMANAANWWPSGPVYQGESGLALPKSDPHASGEGGDETAQLGDLLKTTTASLFKNQPFKISPSVVVQFGQPADGIDIDLLSYVSRDLRARILPDEDRNSAAAERTTYLASPKYDDETLLLRLWPELAFVRREKRRIVDPMWLVECEQQKRLVPLERFLLFTGVPGREEELARQTREMLGGEDKYDPEKTRKMREDDEQVDVYWYHPPLLVDKDGEDGDALRARKRKEFFESAVPVKRRKLAELEAAGKSNK